MSIDWTALGEVALVSMGVTVAIVVIFSVGVLTWPARRETAGAGAGRPLMAAASALCFLACALIAGYGIYLIVPRFH